MRILMIFRAPVGGLFKHVLDLTENYIKKGHEVALVFDSCAKLENKFEVFLHSSEKISVLRMDIPRHPGFSDVANVYKIKNFVRRFKPDVIHGHGAKGGVYSRVVAKLCRVRNFYTTHGGVLHYPKDSIEGFVYRVIERILCKFTDVVFFESNFAKFEYKNFVGHNGEFGPVIYNGIDSNKFKSFQVPFNFDRLVFLGEIRHLKGVQTLLDALALLREKGFSVPLDIYGDGPDRAYYENYQKNLKLCGVHWKGAVPSAFDAFAEGGVLIIPSYRESFSYVALEAAASGLPIIASNVGAVRSILQNDKYIVLPNDHIDLSNKIIEIFGSFETVKSDCFRLKNKVLNEFDVSLMADKVMNYYLVRN